MIRAPLSWIEAFLNGHVGSIVKRFAISAYTGQRRTVRIAVDASPWGLGGILIVDGRIRQYFADAISLDDVHFFNHAVGSPKGQQTWEALAMLAAMRCWAFYWQEEREHVEVTGGNILHIDIEKFGYCKFRTRPFKTTKTGKTIFPFSSPH